MTNQPEYVPICDRCDDEADDMITSRYLPDKVFCSYRCADMAEEEYRRVNIVLSMKEHERLTNTNQPENPASLTTSMELADYFAGLAMQEMLKPHISLAYEYDFGTKEKLLTAHRLAIAREAYELAEAMLAERERRKNDRS